MKPIIFIGGTLLERTEMRDSLLARALAKAKTHADMLAEQHRCIVYVIKTYDEYSLTFENPDNYEYRAEP